MSVNYFPEVGDTLPRHSHEPDAVHLTICALGEFDVVGDGWKMALLPGDVVPDFKAHDPHEFVCTKAPGKLVNIPNNPGGFP